MIEKRTNGLHLRLLFELNLMSFHLRTQTISKLDSFKFGDERDLVILFATGEQPDSGSFLFDIENFKMFYVSADTRQV